MHCASVAMMQLAGKSHCQRATCGRFMGWRQMEHVTPVCLLYRPHGVAWRTLSGSQSACRQALIATQRSAGAWGSSAKPTMIETAYAVLGLYTLACDDMLDDAGWRALWRGHQVLLARWEADRRWLTKGYGSARSCTAHGGLTVPMSSPAILAPNLAAAVDRCTPWQYLRASLCATDLSESIPSKAEFLAAPKEMVARGAPAAMVYAPSGTRRQAVLAGFESSSEAYAHWSRGQMIASCRADLRVRCTPSVHPVGRTRSVCRSRALSRPAPGLDRVGFDRPRSHSGLCAPGLACAALGG